MTKRVRFHLLILLLVLSFSCKAERSAAPMQQDSAGAPAQESAISPRKGLDATAGTPAGVQTSAQARMIIRKATLSLVVRDAVDVLRKASALVEARGGYVSEERQWKVDEQVRASATFRVPSAQLRPTLTAISGLAVRIQSESVTGEDVTEEFSDLGAQLRNLQATESELRELLSTVRQRTQKASEIMEVFTELTKVRGEIERIQGRMQYLSQMTAFSTITVELIPDALAAPVVEPGWQPLATARNALRSLLNTAKVLSDVAIWGVLYLLPVGVIIAAVLLAIRAVWRRLRRPRAVPAP